MATIETPKIPSLKVGSRNYKGHFYYYIQTYTHHYDKKTKNTVRDGQKTVGKILGGDKYGEIQWRPDFIEQFPQLAMLRAYKTENGIEFKPLEPDEKDEPPVPDKVIRPRIIEKKYAGLYWAVSQAMAQTGIGTALNRVFGKYHRDLKLASIITYVLSKRNGGVMHLYPPFARTHYLAWPKELDDWQLCKLLSSIEYDDVNRFFTEQFREYLNNHKELYKRDRPTHVILAVDSTSISTYSEHIQLAEWGKNKDGDDLKQINYMLLCDELTGMPIYGKLLKGNVVDVSTIKNLHSDLTLLFKDIENKPEIVFTTDRGYESNDNLDLMLREGYSFVMRSVIKNKWLIDEVDALKDKLLDYNSYNIFIKQYLATSEVVYKYDPNPIAGKSKSNSAEAKIYVHVYYDDNLRQDKRNTLRYNIGNAREAYNSQVQALYDQKQATAENLAKISINSKLREFIDLYCYFDANGFAMVDAEKINAKLKYAGVMVILSNALSDAKLAYLAYSKRMTVERNFENFKSALAIDRFHVSNARSLQGRFLCEYIASAIYILFQNRIKDYEQTTESKKDKLMLTNMSLPRVMDELDTIAMTCFDQGGYFDEIAGKYVTLYKALGIPLPDRYLEGINLQKAEAEAESEEQGYEQPDPDFIVDAEEL